MKKLASTGSRTRIYCLEGNNANHYTSHALTEHYRVLMFLDIRKYLIYYAHLFCTYTSCQSIDCCYEFVFDVIQFFFVSVALPVDLGITLKIQVHRRIVSGTGHWKTKYSIMCDSNSGPLDYKTHNLMITEPSWHFLMCKYHL